MKGRRARLAGAALVLAAGAAAPWGTAAGGVEPTGAEAAGGDGGLARLQVVESMGVAAVLGLITRVPAETAGGGAYTETHITPDKALGRAAGGYPGPLGEAFVGTSTELYRNPSMVVAQQPPGLFPAEAQVEGGQSGPQGSVGVIRAKATSRSEVEAEVIMGAGPAGAPMVIEGGVSRSHSRVEPDGTVVTEVTTTFGRAVVAEVLEMVGGGGRALARTAPGGVPTLELETTMGAMTLNGVGARMTGDGLAVADQQLASPADVAQFNAGLAQLRQAGITVEAVPAQREEEPGSGRISGAAGLFRYQLPANPIPNSIGNDETFLLAQVSAAAVAIPRSEAKLPTLPDLGGSPPELPAPAPPSREAAALPAPSPVPAAGVLPAGLGFPATPASSFLPTLAGESFTPPEAALTAPAASGGPAGAGSYLGDPQLALPASADRSLVASVTGFYAVLLFLGGAAVMILLGLHKARSA